MSRQADDDDYPLRPRRPRHFPRLSDDDEDGPQLTNGLGKEQLRGLEDSDDVWTNKERSEDEEDDDNVHSSTGDSHHIVIEEEEDGSDSANNTRPYARRTSRRVRATDRSLALARVTSPSGRASSRTYGADEDETERLRRRVAELEARLADTGASRAQTPPPASLGYRPVTFHQIGRDSGRYYLDEPRWVMTDGSAPVLQAYQGISSLRRYLENHSEIAFIFLCVYNDRPPADLSEMTDADGVLRAPKPESQILELTSSVVIEAFDNLTTLVPRFSTMFPGFHADEPMTAPFQVMYYCKPFLDGCISELEPLHQKLVRQVFEVIQKKYGRQFFLADVKAAAGLVNKQLLPFLIKPGDILIEASGAHTQAYRATSWLQDFDSYHVGSAADPEHSTEEAMNSKFENSRLVKTSVLAANVSVVCFTFNGVFNQKKMDLKIMLKSAYDDEDVPINRLNIYPLEHASGTIEEDLVRRGTMLWRCRHHRLVNYMHETGSHIEYASDRYMVDMITCRKMVPKKFSDQLRVGWYTAAEMGDDEPPLRNELLTFPPTVFGYNLRTKQWHNLSLHYVVDVKWNKEAFDHLVAEPQTKTLIQALVTHQLAESESTDVIDSKGSGLVLLLHGGPGTGKTFTAEGVAEFAEKPLLRVTCGDAGVEAREVERYLQNVFRLGHLWDCVVLLDEADVFLEERDIRDLNRNALVSVFLRILEYYQGILILTSNRVGTFDEAFKSRIQLALHYENLGKPQRQKIWRNFLTRVKNLSGSDIDYDDIMDHIEELGAYELNGREIRNVVTTARQLAKYEKSKLQFTQVKHALEVSSKFGEYLTTVFKASDEERQKAAGIR